MCHDHLRQCKSCNEILCKSCNEILCVNCAVKCPGCDQWKCDDLDKFQQPCKMDTCDICKIRKCYGCGFEDTSLVSGFRCNDCAK